MVLGRRSEDDDDASLRLPSPIGNTQFLLLRDILETSLVPHESTSDMTRDTYRRQQHKYNKPFDIKEHR